MTFDLPQILLDRLQCARRGRILLVEPPATVLKSSLEGFRSEVVLDHPKYPLLLLSEDLRQDGRFEGETRVLDLKAGPVESRPRGKIPYGPYELEAFEIGSSWLAVREDFAVADVIAITANFAFERYGVASVLDFSRRIAPGAVRIVGGHDATAEPRWYLEAGAHICALGDGEGAIGSLISLKEERGTTGIAYLSSGQLRRHGRRRSRTLRRDVLPSAVTVARQASTQVGEGPLPKNVPMPIASIETSRGCEEACSFCDSSFISGAYRYLPLEAVSEYARDLATCGVKTLCFLDDNLLYRGLPRFGGSSERRALILFFDGLFEAGFSWSFYNGLQLSLLYGEQGPDLQLIESLFRSFRGEDGLVRGCFRCFLPVEKMTSEEIARLGKLLDFRRTLEVIACIAEQRVPELTIGFIIGDPSETYRRLEEIERQSRGLGDTIRARSSGRTEPRFFPFCSIPLPGTPDHSRFRSRIRYESALFPDLYGQYTSVIGSDELEPWDICRERLRLDLSLNDQIRLNDI